MNNRRTLILIILACVTLLSLSLFSCEEKRPDGISKAALTEKIENKLDAYKTDLLDSGKAFSSNEKASKYLLNWADSKGIRAKEDDGIIIMNVDGSEEYKNAPATLLLCPYDEMMFEDSVHPLLLSFYVLKNNENTGKLTALFIPELGHDFSSVSSLKKKYFKKGMNVICLSGDAHANVSTTTGSCATYEFTEKMSMSKPKNEKAYRITINGITPSQVDNKINSKINPIIEINALFAALKRSSVDYEIAKFSGGRKSLLYPGSCTADIIIDEDRNSTFLKQINRRLESFETRKQEEDKNAAYQFREIPVPGKSLSMNDSSRLVSFVYTLLEDEYARNDETDELEAICDVSYIRVRNGLIKIGSTVCSIDETILEEIDDAEKTLAGLSGFKCKNTGNIPGWSSAEDSAFAESIKNAYKTYTGKKVTVTSTVTPSNAGYVSKLNDKCNILAITVSENTVKDLTGTIMQYLIDSNKEED